MRAWSLAFAGALVVVLVSLLVPARAWALDRTFSGSLQEDYLFVPTEKNNDAQSSGFDGFTTEAALKVAVDVTDHFSANVKVCFGCHGFELDMAYLDYRVADELAFRAGRFSPSFGAFNPRHDPGNQVLSDKPLPYDMGRMLRYTTWNLGVIPSPFPDNGAEISGAHWFGQATQLNYAGYLVSGFKADSESASDLDFVASRSIYYVDNNSRPAGGGRVSVTSRFGRDAEVTAGTSGMYGTYDPENRLSYAIAGGDLALRAGRITVRAEYLVRRTEFDTSSPTNLKYQVEPGSNFFVKHGAFVESEQQLGSIVTLAERADALYRVGNVPSGTDLSFHSSVIRYTAGALFVVTRGLRVKTSAEYWQFSDPGATGGKTDVGIHLALVGLF